MYVVYYYLRRSHHTSLINVRSRFRTFRRLRALRRWWRGTIAVGSGRFGQWVGTCVGQYIPIENVMADQRLPSYGDHLPFRWLSVHMIIYKTYGLRSRCRGSWWDETQKTHAPLSFLFLDRSGTQTELTLFEKPSHCDPVRMRLCVCVVYVCMYVCLTGAVWIPPPT